MKRKLGFRKLSAVGMLFIISCFIFYGCEKEEYEQEPLDINILNSSELEEYIIAGADLQHSLAVFKSKMNKIDFSKLKVTYDTKGRKVVHFSPDLVGSIRIEEKVQIFNEKKEAIQNKFPQLISFRKGEAEKYFQESIKNSVKVRGAFLKLGMNISGPNLKSGDVETWYGAEDEVFLKSYLDEWVNSENYVELYILYYEDGTMSTYQNPEATSSWTSITYQVSDDKMYFPEGGSSSEVISIGHTHRFSSNPSTEDLDSDYPSSVERFIYYNWTYTYY